MVMTTTTILNRLSPLILGCAAALILMGCGSPLHAQTVAVMVNGEPITNYDIDQRSKLNFLTTHKTPVRQQVVDELIDEKVKIKEEVWGRPDRFRCRPVVRSHELADAHDARTARQIPRKPGGSA
jgi:hypothetical protein